jgi:hypothetical protein
VGVYVGDGIGVPGDDAENGFCVGLLDGDGGIGDQGTITAPAFDLGLVEDDVRPIAIENFGPSWDWGGRRGSAGRRLQRPHNERNEDERKCDHERQE